MRVPIPAKPSVRNHLNQIQGDSPAPCLQPGVELLVRPCRRWHKADIRPCRPTFFDAGRAWGRMEP